MNRKKQGTSLIFVIIIFMFVSTVSFAMLSMVVGNYKARVAESKRTENLYASDSGLDVAYTIIGKTFDSAVKYGYYKVETLKDGTNTGPNNDKYYALTLEIEGNDDKDDTLYEANNENKIKGLRDQIDDLESEKNTENADINAINKEIALKKNLIEEDKEMQEILLNEEFKRSFKNFIAYTSTESDGKNLPGLKSLIESNKYVSSKFDSNNIDSSVNEETIEFGFKNKNGEPPTLELTECELSSNNSGNSSETSDEPYPRKEGHSENVGKLKITKSVNQKYGLTITSNFYTDRIQQSEKAAEETNQRKLQAKYIMLVPNYGDVFFKNATGDLNEYVALDRALTIGGDMNVGSSTSTYQTKLIVNNGDVFVNGNPNRISSIGKSYGKYFGGITLNNSDEVKFNKDVITRGTFNIRDNVGKDGEPAQIFGDLYARNIYAGTLDGENYTDNSYFSIDGKAIIDNDLSLKATDTHITIKDFYGINDKNIYYDDNKRNIIQNGGSNPNDKAITSSSIIINGYKDANKNSSSVSITDEAYIMGTAHINTKENNSISDGYQTGESTAVKDKDIVTSEDKANYEAYSVPIQDLNDSSGNPESFEYYDPLQLLKEPNVFTKGEHFKYYWNELYPNSVDRGGISLPSGKIHSVGAVIVYDPIKKQNVVVSANYNVLKDQAFIENMRLDYAEKVYRFGQARTMADYNSFGKNSTTVESLMSFSEDFPNDYNSNNSDDYNIDDEKDSDGEKAVFNNLSDVTLIIQGNGIDYNKKYYDSEGKEITNKKIIKVDDADNISAVIATLGNIIIDGKVTFNGTIIANGNLTINGDVTINYDNNVIERVQAKNRNIQLFDSVFGGNIINNISSEEPNLASIDTKYDLNNFLKNKLWQIMK